jgi:hypothetical protein
MKSLSLFRLTKKFIPTRKRFEGRDAARAAFRMPRTSYGSRAEQF